MFLEAGVGIRVEAQDTIKERGGNPFATYNPTP
jgi:hypothetical protein